MPAEVVEIIVKLTDQVAPSARKITKELTAVQKAGRSLKKGVGAGVNVLSKIPAVAASAAAALAVVKKGFDFAQQGAQIQQMGDSWDFLMTKIGVSPGIIDDLSKAARGTITEMQIMTSTATLLAGAGDDLAQSMAEASPQLLEIAKAANKLNPSLGDTTFLYESIARGVKRASPLILDNLGIVIKIGDAYEQFAKELGKSAKELTNEERQMAVLNATLKAGDNLIDQVGGNVISATDAFAQLATAAGETANLFKSDLFEALGPLVVDMAEGAMFALEYARATDELGLSGFEAGKLIHDFDGTVEEAKQSIIDAAATQKEWFEETDRTVIDGWAAATRGFVEATDDAAESNRNFALSIGEVTLAGAGDIAMGEAVEAYNDAIDAGDTEKAEAVADVIMDIGTNMLGLKPSEVAGSIAIANLTASLGEASTAQELVDYTAALERIVILQSLSSDGIGGLPAIPDVPNIPVVTGDTTERGLTRASGGPLTGVNLVGEQGPELVLGNLVIPADITRRLMALGLNPGKKLGLGGAIGTSQIASTPVNFSFPGDPVSDPTVRGGLNVPGGGGGGASSVVSAAVQASMAASQSAAQETAAVVAAAISPQVSQQSQQILTMQARTAEANARNEALLGQILDVLRLQGTADDTGESMAEAVQFADF